MAESQAIKENNYKQFFDGIKIVGAIIAGWFLIEDRVEGAFAKAIKPLQDEIINIRNDVKEINALKPSIEKSAYRLDMHEKLFNEFLKPEDINFKKPK